LGSFGQRLDRFNHTFCSRPDQKEGSQQSNQCQDASHQDQAADQGKNFGGFLADNHSPGRFGQRRKRHNFIGEVGELVV
jgi:hypothetical protein